MPGLLFIPCGALDIPRWKEVLEYAHIRGLVRVSADQPARLSKAHIEIIREIEAKLNLPPERKGVLFTVGQRVRFANEVYAAFWGTAVVFEIASEARIGVMVEKAIGGHTKAYVPASEIEAM
jgi:transcription antitermination factor NusG